MPRSSPYWRTRLFVLSAFALWVFALAANPAHAQIASADDTLRLEIVPAVNVGQVIDVKVHVHYSDTLGGFTFRLRYDPLVFSPLLDTVIDAGDTSIVVVSSQLHPGSLEHFVGVVREPGVITFVAVDQDLDSTALFLPGSWPAVLMRWEILGNAPLGGTFVDFENDTLFPASFNAMTNWRGTTFVRPVLVGDSLEVQPGPALSDVDTMRVVVAPAIGRDREIDVEVHLRVVDTLGGFTYRLLYDPLVFEPVQDTFVSGNDTVVGIIALDLHPAPFEQFAGSVRTPGEVIFLGADLDLDTSELYLPGSAPTVGMRWRVKNDAPLGVTSIFFENDPIRPATWNAMTDWHGATFIRPVLVDAVTSIECACECRADPALCDGSLDVIDVVTVIQVAFGGAASIPDPNPLCPVVRTDVNCDGVTGIVDVIRFVEVAFRGGDPTQVFCNPCE